MSQRPLKRKLSVAEESAKRLKIEKEMVDEDTEEGDDEYSVSITGRHTSRRFSSTLTIQVGGVQFPAEELHLKISRGLGMAKSKMTENQVAAALGCILINGDGERRFIYYHIPRSFKSGLTSSEDFIAIGDNLERLKQWLVDIGVLETTLAFRSTQHAHSEQALVFDLGANYKSYVDTLAREIRDDETVEVLVLDLCSIPNTICNPCHRSLEGLMTYDEQDWLYHVTNRFLKRNVDVADGSVNGRVKCVIRASAPNVFPGANTQYVNALKGNQIEKVTDIDNIESDIIFLEQVWKRDEAQQKEKQDKDLIRRLVHLLEGALRESEVDEKDTITVSLRRGADRLIVGSEILCQGQHWQIKSVKGNNVELQLVLL